MSAQNFNINICPVLTPFCKMCIININSLKVLDFISLKLLEHITVPQLGRGEAEVPLF